jgi:hypothetical protein
MSSSSSADSSSLSTGSSASQPTDTQEGPIECRVCGRQFDDMAEMQRHMLTDHMQKGDLPNEEH